jgi:hypothetical protein
MHERRKLLHLPQQTTTKQLMALLLFTSSMASRFQPAQGFSRLSAFLGGPSSSFRRTYSSTPSSSLSMKLQTAIVGYVRTVGAMRLVFPNFLTRQPGLCDAECQMLERAHCSMPLQRRNRPRRRTIHSVSYNSTGRGSPPHPH